MSQRRCHEKIQKNRFVCDILRRIWYNQFLIMEYQLEKVFGKRVKNIKVLNATGYNKEIIKEQIIYYEKNSR